MQERLRNVIAKVVGEMWPEKTVSFVVEHPALEEHGDYSTNVSLLLGEKPRDAATKIVAALQSDPLLDDIEKMEIAGPGFINFWIKKEWLINELKEIDEKKKKYGRGNWAEGKKVLVEYSSPNIAKEFSVGHLRSTIIGQALYNLYAFGGARVVGDNHLGDWGTQFGIIVAAIEEKGLVVDQMSISEMEELYVEYNKRAKEDESLLEKGREAFARLEGGDATARAIWEGAIKKSMEEFSKIYGLLGVKIDHTYGESYYEKLMPSVIEEAKEKGLAKESQGALVIEFPSDKKTNFEGGEEEFELPVAMLLKSNKTTTYFTRDLATVKYRESQEELKSDLYIYEVGAEQSLHFKQVFLAAEKLWGVDREKFRHVAHGLVLGADGKKMSTRKGTGVKMEELLMRMINNATEINPASAKEVGVGAVKFFDLKHKPETSYRFDWKEALRLDGDSGPYVQYAVVRGKSVIKKAKSEASYKTESLSQGELDLVRYLYRFPEVIEAAAMSFSPNILAEFLLEIAKRFNTFYNQEQIIGSEKQGFKLGLVSAVVTVLENGLELLGIEIPEEM